MIASEIVGGSGIEFGRRNVEEEDDESENKKQMSFLFFKYILG